ncbi:Putative conserved hypothetical protein [Candidatus Fokinia solitaria]|uniref:Uncharacterized protein n=1 Tax=Candidatus Fokinia solitaria TaxID=1802984 RepID=A0A2U8BS06_9RICK|nr:DUF6119 family protein [Candidatus Fokinia solitaria]AWD33117.1 Putative conserved hypothetical protein [Candidatus Fokinia solitaria]
MSKEKQEKHKFTVKLLKEKKIARDAVKEAKCEELKGETKEKCEKSEGSFIFYKRNSDESNFGKKPWWIDYFALDKTKFKRNFVESLLVFVTVKDKEKERIFAYTFGVARYWLREECIESDFGYKVALNTIDPTKIKSVDARSLEGNAKDKRVVFSKGMDIEEYDCNKFLDFIHRISGKVKEQYKHLFDSVAGSESLMITATKSKDELIALSKELLERFESDDYKNDDSLKEINMTYSVADIEVTERLDEELGKLLKKRDYSTMSFSDVKILDPDIFEYYLFNGKKYYDMEEIFDAWRDMHGSVDFSSADVLGKELRKTITVYTNDDKELDSWKVKQCLNADNIKFDDNEYMFLRKKWYKVDRDFLSYVEKEVKEYEINDEWIRNIFVDYDSEKYQKKGQGPFGEQEYNIDCCNANSEQLVLFDRKMVQSENHGKIEICDVYCKSTKTFFHIKKGEKTALMSHLWIQGLTSAFCLNAEDKRYVSKFKECTKLSSFPSQSEIKICYAIISHKKALATLSNFSLYAAIGKFKEAGFKKEQVKYFFINEIKAKKN